MIKHRIGSDYTFKDSPENTVSGRYVEWKPEFYIPAYLRKQSKNNKQASVEEEIDYDSNCPRGYRKRKFLTEFEDHCEDSYIVYEDLLEAGVCKEQARMILPLNLYTEWWWTASFQALGHFILQRSSPDAQWETRQYAITTADLIRPIMPYTCQSLDI